MVMEEPDIEIGAGVSSKGKFRRVATDFQDEIHVVILTRSQPSQHAEPRAMTAAADAARVTPLRSVGGTHLAAAA